MRAFLKKLGADIALDEATERVINDAIALRNIIVHNGSRVDVEFLRTTRRTDVKPGQSVRIDRKTFKKAIAAFRLAADAFQIALGVKYFGVGESQISPHHPVFRDDREASTQPEDQKSTDFDNHQK